MKRVYNIVCKFPDFVKVCAQICQFLIYTLPKTVILILITIPSPPTFWIWAVHQNSKIDKIFSIIEKNREPLSIETKKATQIVCNYFVFGISGAHLLILYLLKNMYIPISYDDIMTLLIPENNKFWIMFGIGILYIINTIGLVIIGVDMITETLNFINNKNKCADCIQKNIDDSIDSSSKEVVPNLSEDDEVIKNIDKLTEKFNNM